MIDPRVEREAIALFERMLELPEARRDAWAVEETAGRPDVAVRLAAMREADRRAQMRTGTAVDTLDEEPPPERIGVYRIVERIGRGGMGSVYRGERDAGDFAHVVAMKVIKPGLLSETLVERFERERQTLASLSHPHIARLYDGGETEGGSPYIVMEHVDGLPLPRWIEERQPSRAERQRLFLEICGAVAFAHRNLVVHRDLTPSNVMVTGDGAAKLIDFGIAKPADETRNIDASAASIGSLSLTPGYAAPERMTSTEVTTAADIYSLGRLLGRLLPPEPGDRELRAIIARATASDPRDRYPTADALGADVAAWRDGLPVTAMAGGRRYAFAKFVGRHRIGVAAGAGALLLLIGAFTLTLLANMRAERALAQSEQRFEETRALANFMLFDLNDRLERIAGTTRTREALVAQARRYLEILAGAPETSPELTRDIARGFVRLAVVQGVPGHPNIGAPGDAKASLDEAERQLLSLGAPNDPAVAAPLARARAYRALILLHAESRPREASGQIEEGLAALAAVPAPARDWPWFEARSLVRRAQLESADLANETAELERLARTLAAEVGQWPAERRATPRAGLDRAIATQYLATARYNAGEQTDYEAGLALFQQADGLYAELEAAVPNDPILLYWRGWNAYYGYAAAGSLGRMTQAAALLRQARDSAERLLAIEPNESITTFAERLREAQAELFVNQGRHAEAIALQREIVAGRRARVTAARSSGSLSDLAYGHAILGAIARRAADRALACESWQRAEALMAEVDARGDLRGFLQAMRGPLVANLERCAAGAPIGSFSPLS